MNNKEKIVQVIVNLFKVKSIVTFVAAGMFIYTTVTEQLEAATVTAILMMVFQSLFDRSKRDKNDL